MAEKVKEAAAGASVRFEVGPEALDVSIRPVRGRGGEVAYLAFEMRDLPELRQVKTALEESEERLHTLMEAAPEVIIFKDGRNRCLKANSMTLRFFRLEGTPYLGKDNLGLAELSPLFREALQVCEETDEIAWGRRKKGVVEELMPWPGGGTKILEVIKAPVFYPDGSRKMLIVFGRDVTERRAAEEALHKAHAELERRVEERTAELARANADLVREISDRRQAEKALQVAWDRAELYMDLMGHDISNMNQIAMGYLELALDTICLTDPEKELLAKPLEVLKRNSRLVENVRKLQRISEGGTTLVPVDLAKVLLEVGQDFGAVPGAVISTRVDTAAGHYVLANDLLRDVFSNLVDNAVKHSNGGPVEVTIGCVRCHRGEKARLQVFVEDSGPGVADPMKSRIFNRLERDKNAKGMGLGLYLVRSLTESFGGKVWVEDRVPGEWSRGCRFVVELPAWEPSLWGAS